MRIFFASVNCYWWFIAAKKQNGGSKTSLLLPKLLKWCVWYDELIDHFYFIWIQEWREKAGLSWHDPNILGGNANSSMPQSRGEIMDGWEEKFNYLNHSSYLTSAGAEPDLPDDLKPVIWLHPSLWWWRPELHLLLLLSQLEWMFHFFSSRDWFGDGIDLRLATLLTFVGLPEPAECVSDLAFSQNPCPFHPKWAPVSKVLIVPYGHLRPCCNSLSCHDLGV